ncbi:hypothetical protein pneo_cds_1019 [Pandoravirus neocaledonia]|uniref:Uncharacterized protein n=1 Tax=Pandoravirus neocaledonia TaxID=2107708 RepID=A0A2U7UDX1_9VIRU|nr:hypothetical protein pneo_cds_1019 [Pandoravirus neocaledonia]AVK76626.1 hypothetical protein pneo_cds_1019 [Pandoravirus neocaledonia]
MFDSRLWAMIDEQRHHYRRRPSWPSAVPSLFVHADGAAAPSYPLCALVVLPENRSRFYGALVCRPLPRGQQSGRAFLVASAEVATNGHVFRQDPLDSHCQYEHLSHLAAALSSGDKTYRRWELNEPAESLVRLACKTVAQTAAATLSMAPVLGRDLPDEFNISILQRHVPSDGPPVHVAFFNAQDTIALLAVVVPARTRTHDRIAESTLQNRTARLLANKLAADDDDLDQLMSLPMHLRSLVATHALAGIDNRPDVLPALARLLNLDPRAESSVALTVGAALAVDASLFS